MHICVDPLLIRFMLKTTQKCTSFLILGTNTYNKLTIYLLLILISELLEYHIVKYVVFSIVCIIRCYIFAFLINYPSSIDKIQKNDIPPSYRFWRSTLTDYGGGGGLDKTLQTSKLSPPPPVCIF